MQKIQKTKKNKQGENGGKPQKVLNDAEIMQVEALASVLSIKQIADYFGMVRNTFYAIMERQPEVFEHYKKGKSKAISSVGQGLLQKAINGDTASAIFYLKTQAGWKEKQDVNIDLQSSDGTMTPQTLNLNDFYKDKNKV